MLEHASKNPREWGFSKLISRQSEGFEVFEIIFQGERLSLARSRGFSSFELFSLGNVRSLEKKGVFRLTSPSRPDSSTASQCAREHFDRSSQRMLDSIPESPFLAPFRDPNFHLIFQNPHENRLECVFLSNLVEIRWTDRKLQPAKSGIYFRFARRQLLDRVIQPAKRAFLIHFARR